MRLKTEFWVKGYLRQRQAAGAFGAVVVHGHDDAGAVLIRINALNGTSALYGPAPMSFDDEQPSNGERRFARLHEANWLADTAIDALIAQQRSYDSDLWVIEVEDKAGLHGLDGWLATPSE